MADFFAHLFDTSGFLPRWACGEWPTSLAVLEIVANVCVGLAYTAIPVVLAVFTLRRRDIPFPRVFWLFVAFLSACGATHLLDAVTFYWPAYRLDALVRVMSAVLSWLAVVALLRVIPTALRLRSPQDLEREVDRRSLQLRLREAHVRAVLEASADGILTFDPDGRIEQENPACQAMFGYPGGGLVGHDVRELVLPEGEDGDRPFRAGRFRAVGRRRDGSTFPIHLSISEMVNGRRLFVANVDDLSDLRRAEEERRRLEDRIQQVQKLESLGVLAGGIAHDFNNLLVAILGNADLAYQQLPRTSPARDCIEHIRKASTRAADLCKQMLAYSGRGRFVVRSFDLSKLVEDMAHLVEASIPKSTLLNYDFEQGLPAVEGDMTQIRQVVLNLITNAADAVGNRSGTITVRTGVMNADRAYLSSTYLDNDLPEGRYVFLEVSDTGCGMDDATRKRIFDPFFTTKETGRGLGLAAVLGIVRGHKGAIQVYSQQGRGTSMKVLLPSVDQAPEPEESPSRFDTTWRGSGEVLVIDDDPGILLVARGILELAGFTVHTAAAGRAGLERFRELGDRCRAVLLDLTMPDMNGEQVFQEIRRIRPDARVLLSSGYNEVEVTGRFAGKGLAGFVQKPYRVQELIGAMRTVLEASANHPHV